MTTTTNDGRQLMMEYDLWWKTDYDGRRIMMEDDLWWKTTYDGRQLMMEDNLWWKTTMRMTSKTKRTCTGGRHMALDIFRFAVFFFKGSSHSRRLLFGIWTSHRSSNQMERLGLIWATYSPPHLKGFLSISKTKSNQSLLKVKHFRPKSCLLFNKAIFNKKKIGSPPILLHLL